MDYSSTKIEIKGLKLYAYHGVMEQERRVGNMFEVSVTLYVNAREAVATDILSATVNYSDIINIVKAQMSVPSRLLEHVAGRIKNAIINYSPRILGGTVKVEKIHPPVSDQIDSVAVSISW